MDVDELWNALQSKDDEGDSTEDKVTTEMRSAFKLFDPESKGTITVANLKMVCNHVELKSKFRTKVLKKGPNFLKSVVFYSVFIYLNISSNYDTSLIL